MTLVEIFDHAISAPNEPKEVHGLVDGFNKNRALIDGVSDKITTNLGLYAKWRREANSAHDHAARKSAAVSSTLTLARLVTVRTKMSRLGLMNFFKPRLDLDLLASWRYGSKLVSHWKFLKPLSHAIPPFPETRNASVGI